MSMRGRMVLHNRIVRKRMVSRIMLIRLFQQTPIDSAQPLLDGLERFAPPRISLYDVGLRPVPRPSKVWNAAMGCLRRLWRKTKFIKVNLELIAAHAVIGPDQPLLEIADGAVCQRQHGLGTFPQFDS